MKFWIGIALIICGIVLGLYVGVWLMFIGGIVQIIDQIKAVDTSMLSVFGGVLRIMFAGFIGWVSAFVLIVPGAVMLDSK